MSNAPAMTAQGLLKSALDKFLISEDIFGRIMSWSILVETYLILRASFYDLDELIAKGVEFEKNLPEVLDFNIFAYGSYIGILTEDFKSVKYYIKKMEALLNPYSIWDTAQYNYVSGVVSLITDDLSKARFHIDKGIELGKICGSPYSMATLLLLDSIYHLGKNDIGSARKILDQLSENRSLLHSNHINFIYNLLCADCAFQENQHEQGLENLASAFKVAEKNGLMMPLGIKREKLAVLLGFAIKENPETRMAAELIKLMRLTPPEHMHVREIWPWIHRIYALGKIQIVHNDQQNICRR